MLNWWTIRPDFSNFFKRAWSIRLHVIGGVIQGINLYWIAFVDKIPAIPFFMLGLAFNVAGVIAAAIHQTNLHQDDSQ